MSTNNIIFKTENISKIYPGTKALQDISLEIREGEVAGLIGENGAGKSTLLKLIMGVEAPTSGEMHIRGKLHAPKNPKQANMDGVGMVFQEQSLVTNLTVAQNIFFGEEQRFRRIGFINWKKMGKATRAVLEAMDLEYIKPEVRIRDLNFATRQMVEIAKVFNAAVSTAHEKALILLDEPTSVLSDDEIKQLYNEINKLKEKGNAIVFVSHRLDEVLHISDRIFVFKDGQEVGSFEAEDANESILYERMVGRASTGKYYKVDKQSKAGDELVLKADKLSLYGAFKDVSFKLHKGEVLGICGVVGSGKEELCAVLCGDEEPTSGEFTVKGKQAHFTAPHQALKAGIISIPKERREEGILSILTVNENINISNLKDTRITGLPLLSKKKQIGKSTDWINKLNIKCYGHKELVNQLSGGNAQKVIFARALSSNSDILILNHPTRGIDVGAKEEIFELIRSMTENGLSIILLGDTLDESIGLSSKILVMKDGLVTKQFDAPKDNKPEEFEIVKYMM